MRGQLWRKQLRNTRNIDAYIKVWDVFVGMDWVFFSSYGVLSWWKWSLNIFDVCHSPCSLYISSQFKNYEGYVRDSPSCHHHYQDSNWGNIFWKNGVQFFLRYHEISRSPEATLEANDSRNLTKTLVRDSVYFHPSAAHHLRPVPIFKHVAKMKMRVCTASDFPVGHQSSPTYHL